ncbi:MAG TPA: hypothetical protein VHC97_19910 [Thermoanaerobaculia bacterium]|nr:hypothetical protein [Thermoanaerobaculia bacterium]
MSVNIGDFIGSWKINWATGPGNVLNDAVLLIGTGSGWGDAVPWLTGEYQTAVGFALVEGGQLVHLVNDSGTSIPLSSSAEQEGNQPLYFLYDGNQLRWTGFFNELPLRIFISAAEIQLADGDRFLSLYGNTIYRDPDQIGVWGGTGTPPPDPPSPRKHPKKPGKKSS